MDDTHSVIASLIPWLTVIGTVVSVVVAIATYGFLTGRWVGNNERERRNIAAHTSAVPLGMDDRRLIENAVTGIRKDVEEMQRDVKRTNDEVSELAGRITTVADLRDRVIINETRMQALYAHLEGPDGLFHRMREIERTDRRKS